MHMRRTRHGPIGLDIGASSIKLLQLADEAGEPRVLAAAYCDLSEIEGDARGAAARVIGNALGEHPFRGREVVTALGVGEFQMKSIRLPKMPPDELASAVEFEAQERFDLGDGPAHFRHLLMGEVRHGDELKVEVIVFAAGEEATTARLELLDSLGLNPLAIDIAPCAVARSFVRFLRRAEDAHSINVFLDVGYRGTGIIFTRGCDISFLKVIDIGGQQFNKAVAHALSISVREAADLRLRIMRDSDGGRRAGDHAAVPEEMKAVVADAVRPLVERLSRDVQLCTRYFAVTFRGQKPESLTFVGGEAHEPLLLPLISEAVDVPCMIGHPLRGISRLGSIAGRDRRITQPAWAVASGLALRGSPWVRKTPEALGALAGAT